MSDNYYIAKPNHIVMIKTYMGKEYEYDADGKSRPAARTYNLCLYLSGPGESYASLKFDSEEEMNEHFHVLKEYLSGKRW